MSVGISSLARAGKGEVSVKLPENTVMKVPVAAIHATPKGFVKDTRSSAEAQIKEYGITEPVVLWSCGNELYLLRGANTLKAATALKMNEVPAIILTVEERAAKAFAKQVNAVEKAAEQSTPVPSIHEEKFRAVKSVKTDLPYYLL